MTQFQPPPPPIAAHPASPSDHKRPWSTAAVAGFICSLLGCAALPAVLGIILGIVGIGKTKGGQLRGRGLAIAAIPLSLITLAIGATSMFSLYFIAQPLQMATKLPALFAKAGSDPAAAVQSLKAIGSQRFTQSVSDEKITAWMQQVTAKHGKLTEMDQSKPPDTKNTGKGFVLSWSGKFVNGPAAITLSFVMEGLKLRLDDIAVDGFSPQDVK